MRQRDFWTGVAAGAGAAIGTAWAFGMVGRGGSSRIVRLEKSVQIGRPLEEVFERWSRFENLPQYSEMIESVDNHGNHSHWRVNLDGRPFEWRAEVTQFIPNEAIGWKSISGTKHTGRVTFSKLGDDTVVHVQMNYAPPLWALRPAVSVITGRIEGYIEQALRDFKGNMEAKEGAWLIKNAGSGTQQRSRPGNQPLNNAEVGKVGTGNVTTGNFGGGARSSEWNQGQATGTEGVGPAPNANPTYGQPDTTTVEYTRPPDESYLKNK